MLRVTDVDGTVVFTAQPGDGRVVQRYRSGRCAVMDPTAWEAFGACGRSASFLVATTRTAEEFKRLDLPPVRFALTSNGLDLTVDGVCDASWRRETERRLAGTAAGFEEVARVADAILAPLDVAMLVADSYLAVGVTDRLTAETAAERLDPLVAPLGWRADASGRKLYLLARELDKAHGVAALIDRLGGSGHSAAGDAALDEGMLRAAAATLVPRNSWLARIPHPRHPATRAAGVPAGREIMDWFMGAT